MEELTVQGSYFLIFYSTDIKLGIVKMVKIVNMGHRRSPEWGNRFSEWGIRRGEQYGVLIQ